MILSMSVQAQIFILTVAIGFFIGFIYDLFRVVRRILAHPNFLIQIEDILFWIFVTLLMFFIMFSKNFGEIRAFNILGVFIGGTLYFSTISKLFLKASNAIVNFIKRLLLLLLRVILAPFKLFWRLLRIPLNYLRNSIKKIYLSFKNLLHKIKNYAKIRVRKTYRDIKIIKNKK